MPYPYTYKVSSKRNYLQRHLADSFNQRITIVRCYRMTKKV